MADDQNDRKLPATPRRLQRAREEGQVARSRDLGHFAAIATGGAVLVALAPQINAWTQRLLAEALRFDHTTIARPDAMTERLSDMAFKLMLTVLPFGLLMLLVAVAGSVAIGGWNWTLKPLAPKFDKLNPIAGLPRLFSKQQLVDTLKACLLALVLGTIGAVYLAGHVDRFATVIAMPLPAALGEAGQVILSGLMLLLLALALFAAVDAPLQRYLHASRLKMSHQEVKQEHKEVEGNAEVDTVTAGTGHLSAATADVPQPVAKVAATIERRNFGECVRIAVSRKKR